MQQALTGLLNYDSVDKKCQFSSLTFPWTLKALNQKLHDRGECVELNLKFIIKMLKLKLQFNHQVRFKFKT